MDGQVTDPAYELFTLCDSPSHHFFYNLDFKNTILIIILWYNSAYERPRDQLGGFQLSDTIHYTSIHN